MKKFLITTLLTLSFAGATVSAQSMANADYSISPCSYFDVVVL